MNITFSGTYVMRSYGTLENVDTGVSLAELLENTFKKGAIVSLKMAVEYIQRRPICKEENKYDYKCGEVLNDDGTCPNVSHHKEEGE